MNVRTGSGICQMLNQEFVISDHLKGIHPLLNTACCVGLLRLPFCSVCTLEFPTNLLGLTVTELIVHGIPESINTLPFAASIQ